MSKQKQIASRKLTFLIRLLIVLIFLVALVVAAGRLIEFNRKRREAEALGKEKEKYEQSAPPETAEP